MRIIFCFFFIVFLSACTSSHKADHIILKYSDFGPQIIANPLLGMEWWQWEDHGDSTPTDYAINVIVYNEVSLKEITKKYPVNPQAKIDYRYIHYDQAISYLNQQIADDVLSDVTTLLKKTKNTIESQLSTSGKY